MVMVRNFGNVLDITRRQDGGGRLIFLFIGMSSTRMYHYVRQSGFFFLLFFLFESIRSVEPMGMRRSSVVGVWQVMCGVLFWLPCL